MVAAKGAEAAIVAEEMRAADNETTAAVARLVRRLPTPAVERGLPRQMLAVVPVSPRRMPVEPMQERGREQMFPMPCQTRFRM